MPEVADAIKTSAIIEEGETSRQSIDDALYRATQKFFAADWGSTKNNVAGRNRHYRLRYTFCLRRYAEMQNQNVADLLGVSNSCATNWWHRALEEIGIALSEAGRETNSDELRKMLEFPVELGRRKRRK